MKIGSSLAFHFIIRFIKVFVLRYLCLSVARAHKKLRKVFICRDLNYLFMSVEIPLIIGFIYRKAYVTRETWML